MTIRKRVGIADVERVAGTGDVDVETRVVLDQAVIDRVVDAAEGEGGTEVVALGGVVVDHVQDHLDAGGVQRLDHLLELGDLLAKRAADGKARVWREKPDRVVAPVVRQTARDDRHLVEPVVDRQKLHRGHAKIAQVLDGRRVRQPEIGSAQFRQDLGKETAEPLDVRLVDDGLAPGNSWRCVTPPVERGIDDDAARHRGSIVAWAAVMVVGAWSGARDRSHRSDRSSRVDRGWRARRGRCSNLAGLKRRPTSGRYGP